MSRELEFRLTENAFTYTYVRFREGRRFATGPIQSHEGYYVPGDNDYTLSQALEKLQRYAIPENSVNLRENGETVSAFTQRRDFEEVSIEEIRLWYLEGGDLPSPQQRIEG